MSGYLKSTVFETDFDGDHVKVRLKPLLLEDLLKIEAASEGDESPNIPQIAATFQQILPRYIQELSGLTDQAGSPITVEELCSQVYFVWLVAQIGQALVNAAQVKAPLPQAAPSGS